MRILFVHGMGATPFDCLPTFLRLKRLGYKTDTFAYFSSFQSLETIKTRLMKRVTAIASDGQYALVGHSLGGILLRDVLMRLPAGTIPPRHLFLLGSPIVATEINKRLCEYGAYKFLFRECGQLVASDERMNGIHIPSIPTTCVVGTSGLDSRGQPNDSIVLESELCTERFSDVVRIATRHPFLPATRELSNVIHQRLGV